MKTVVSAIVTGYNYAHFLPAAIESVLGQTRVPDEIIVVDDGSTDGTAAVVGEYAGRGVRYIFRENGGAAAARNTGLRESTGDLIAFLDGDDRWLPPKTALQLAHLERYPDVGLVTGSECQVHNAGGPSYYLHRKPVGSAWFYPHILIENCIGNPSLTLVRRSCFDRVGLFDERLPLGQDWEMWIRIAREFKVGVVDATLLLFMRHAASLTAGRVAGRYASNRQIQRMHIRQIRHRPTRVRLLMQAQSMNLYYTGVSLAEGQAGRGKALGAAVGAALLDPTYESRNKAGLLLRMIVGQPAFNAISRLRPRRSADGVLPDCGA